MAVNDPFVIAAFAEYLQVKNLISFIADGNGEFTKALGMEMDLSAVQLGQVRSKRFSMIVKNNIIIELNAEKGAEFSEISCATRILEQIAPTK